MHSSAKHYFFQYHFMTIHSMRNIFLTSSILLFLLLQGHRTVSNAAAALLHPHIQLQPLLLLFLLLLLSSLQTVPRLLCCTGMQTALIMTFTVYTTVWSGKAPRSSVTHTPTWCGHGGGFTPAAAAKAAASLDVKHPRIWSTQRSNCPPNGIKILRIRLKH